MLFQRCVNQIFETFNSKQKCLKKDIQIQFCSQGLPGWTKQAKYLIKYRKLVKKKCVGDVLQYGVKSLTMPLLKMLETLFLDLSYYIYTDLKGTSFQRLSKLKGLIILYRFVWTTLHKIENIN